MAIGSLTIPSHTQVPSNIILAVTPGSGVQERRVDVTSGHQGTVSSPSPEAGRPCLLSPGGNSQVDKVALTAHSALLSQALHKFTCLSAE